MKKHFSGIQSQSNKVTVYWSDVTKSSDWSILYHEPKNLYQELHKNKTKEEDNFFFCPAVRSIHKNTYVIYCPQDSKYKVGKNGFEYLNKNNVGALMRQAQSLEGNPLFQLNYSWLFFAEESLEIKVTAPYMQKAPHLQYGAVMSGKYDIGKWFRNINLEFNIWEEDSIFELKEGEPIAYIEFLTDKKIEFKRFLTNQRLDNIVETCASSASWESKVPLSKRYKRFIDSGTRDIVLKEIKDNLV